MSDDQKSNQADQLRDAYAKQQRDYEEGGPNPAGGAGSTSTTGDLGVDDEVRGEHEAAVDEGADHSGRSPKTASGPGHPAT